ncbi:MAG: hypothetical protein KA105_08325 [Caulobacter sp.]|jgi:hypothetical protein|nr:hypothetical protein [Caulobacter sp.]
MKFPFVVAAMIALAGPTAALARAADAPAASHAAHFSVETTPIADLAADPAAKALVAKHFPGLFEHSSYDMIKGMSLKAVAPYSQGAITDERLAALQKDFDALH